MGEVAPSYFGSSDARTRIARLIPRARLIFVFRHPLQRLLSLYRLKRACGKCPGDLDRALAQDPELVESSLYATHLRKWQACFPPGQISIHLYEDMRSHPQGFVDRICDFLDIPRFRLREAQIRQVFSSVQLTEPRSHVVPQAGTALLEWMKAPTTDTGLSKTASPNLTRLLLGNDAVPDIPESTLRRIWMQVQAEIEGLEKILGRDLSYWKPPAAARIKSGAA